MYIFEHFHWVNLSSMVTSNSIQFLTLRLTVLVGPVSYVQHYVDVLLNWGISNGVSHLWVAELSPNSITVRHLGTDLLPYRGTKCYVGCLTASCPVSCCHSRRSQVYHWSCSVTLLWIS